MSDVLFDTGSYTLKPGAREKLAKISGIVLAHPGLNLQIEGHTDSVGSDEFNQSLSERRGGCVGGFLSVRGAPGGAACPPGVRERQPVGGGANIPRGGRAGGLGGGGGWVVEWG